MGLLHGRMKPDDKDAVLERRRIVEETIARGYRYVADSDSRAVGTSHPDGNLWDNGSDAVAELEKLLRRDLPQIERLTMAQLGSALGVHAGPGSLVVAVQPFTTPPR